MQDFEEDTAKIIAHPIEMNVDESLVNIIPTILNKSYVNESNFGASNVSKSQNETSNVNESNFGASNVSESNFKETIIEFPESSEDFVTLDSSDLALPVNFTII